MTTPSVQPAASGVCPHCYRGKVLIDAITGKPLKADESTYGASWETCKTCNGTGQQPATLSEFVRAPDDVRERIGADVARRVDQRMGQQPAAAGVVRRYELPTGPRREWLGGDVTVDLEVYVRASDYDALQAKVARLEADAARRAWQPMETAPKDRLVDIAISNNDGTRVVWHQCYYDRICDHWRTTRPGGNLVWVRARHVTHWKEPDSAPAIDAALQGEARE